MKKYLIALVVFISACGFPPAAFKKPITVIQAEQQQVCMITIKSADGDYFTIKYSGVCAHKPGDIYSE